MALSNALINELVKVTSPNSKESTADVVYGTAKVVDDRVYVVLDGSEIQTPAETTVKVSDGERVSVVFQNHVALITGNATNNAVRIGDLTESESNVRKEITDTVNGIVLRVTVDGEVSTEIKMEDGTINLTGDVMARYINTDELFTRLITLTGALLVKTADSDILGKLGGIEGSTGSETTYGIGMQNSDASCEVVTTSSGSRMSAGSYEMVVTKNGTAAIRADSSSLILYSSKTGPNGSGVYITGVIYHRDSEDGEWLSLNRISASLDTKASKADVTAQIQQSIDDTLSTTSTNAIQNKAVKKAIDDVNTAIGKVNSSVSAVETSLDTKASKSDLSALETSLETSLDTKASKSDLSALGTSVNAKASKSDLSALETSLETSLGTKASKSDLSALATSLETSLDTKASKSDLSALGTSVNAKASKSDLSALETSLETSLGTKASKSDLNALETSLDTKASKSDLNALETSVNAKASKADVTAQIRQAILDSWEASY